MMNDICKQVFKHFYTSDFWHMPYAQRKAMKQLVKDHIIEDLKNEKYINLFIDVLSLMHIESVNLNFIKFTPKFESQD